MKRKGLLILQDFVAWGILIVIAALFLVLFLAMSHFTKERYTGSEAEITEVAFSVGGDLLRGYLATPTDLPVEKYTPAGMTGAMAPLNGTFADAIARALNDEECRKAINAYAYPDVKEHEYEEVLNAAVGDAECTAFVQRTALFFRALADEDRYTLQARQGGKVLRLGGTLLPYVGPPYDTWFLWEPDAVNKKSDQLIKPIGEMLLRVPRNVHFGTQHLPGDIEVKLILVDRKVDR